MAFGNYPPGFSGMMLEQYFEQLDNQPRCENCKHYNHKYGACSVLWNNLDESYYIPNRDDCEPDDHCARWEEEEDDSM